MSGVCRRPTTRVGRRLRESLLSHRQREADKEGECDGVGRRREEWHHLRGRKNEEENQRQPVEPHGLPASQSARHV
jgi:hypothetical protein